jgi:hypothetical protein
MVDTQFPETREEVTFMNNTTGTVHKEAKGGTSRAHLTREVTITITISIQTSLS